MTNRENSSGLARRSFLGGATLAGVASAIAPRVAVAQAPIVAPPPAPSTSVTARTAERLAGAAVNYAYATKAGPFVFLNGHEGYDFEAGVIPTVTRAPGFPAYGRPGYRRADKSILILMRELLQ